MWGGVGIITPPVHRRAGGQHAGVRGGLARDWGLHRQIIRHGEAGHGRQSTVCVCEGCVCSAQHGAGGEGGNRRGGLWDGLVDAGAETAADGNMTRCVAGLSSLIPQLFFSSPFGPSIRKPYLYSRFR